MAITCVRCSWKLVACCEQRRRRRPSTSGCMTSSRQVAERATRPPVRRVRRPAKSSGPNGVASSYGSSSARARSSTAGGTSRSTMAQPSLRSASATVGDRWRWRRDGEWAWALLARMRYGIAGAVADNGRAAPATLALPRETVDCSRGPCGRSGCPPQRARDPRLQPHPEWHEYRPRENRQTRRGGVSALRAGTGG